MTRQDPTLAERIASLISAGEIAGYVEQRGENITTEERQMLATRAAEIMKGRAKERLINAFGFAEMAVRALV